MRLLLTSLLLALPVASPASLTGTLTVQGHAAGTFGHLSMPERTPTGGVTWSPDSREVYTLDTTGELRRWQAATGAALGRQVIAMPKEVGDAPTLSLHGMTGEFLQLEARGWRQNRSVRLSYTFSPRSGKTFRSDPCPTSQLSLQACTQAGQVRARVEGQNVVQVEAGQTTRLSLPRGVKPVALALSDNGERLALLAITPKDTYGLHGTATLFLRVQRLAFSPDGAVVSAQVWNPRNGQGQVQAWTAEGQPLKVPPGTTFPVSRVVLTEANDKNGPQQGSRPAASLESPFGRRSGGGAASGWGCPPTGAGQRSPARLRTLSVIRWTWNSGGWPRPPGRQGRCCA